jgi:beta-lactamase class A
MTPRVFHAIALASSAIFAPPLAAQSSPEVNTLADQAPLDVRADQVVSLLNGTVQPEDIFTDGFRAAVADAQITALSANLTAQLGSAIYAELLEPHDGTRAALQIRFERGIAKGGIAIDPAQENRVSELRFTSVEALTMDDDTPEKVSADLAALPGSVNAWFGPLDGGAPVIRYHADVPLAVGSTFKLYVLAALAEDVKDGRRRWTDVVAMTEKSYPSGQLQNWPKGAPVTLHTLASLMISISDNTATDQLIKELGKERILGLMGESHRNPYLNQPLLTTRELFVTKADKGLTELRQRGRRGDEDALIFYQALLDAPDRPVTLDDVNSAFANGPKALDVEWFASPVDFADLFAHMRGNADPEVFKIMAINPSATPAILANWDYVGFKGGSEPGVLNLTWLLTDKDGRDWILSLGWNNPAAVLDEGKLLAIAQRTLLLPR